MAKTALILIAGLVSFVFSFDAKAFPVLPAAQVATSDVMKVRGFCGLGFHRGPYGGCVRTACLTGTWRPSW